MFARSEWLYPVTGTCTFVSFVVIPGYMGMGLCRAAQRRKAFWLWGYAAPRSGAKRSGYGVMLSVVTNHPFITLTP